MANEFEIKMIPPRAIYLKDFITETEEAQILSQIENTPKPRWTQLSNRRLINYGGVPHSKGMIAEAMPDWLKTYVTKADNALQELANDYKKPNHVLVNEYLPGQGIMPHTDGPLFHPVVFTISCGSHTFLEFYKRPSQDANAEPQSKVPEFKFLIEPRSVLMLTEELYTDYLHGISEMEEDVVCEKVANLGNCEASVKIGDVLKRTKRISLTIRHVPKTSKIQLRF